VFFAPARPTLFEPLTSHLSRLSRGSLLTDRDTLRGLVAPPFDATEWLRFLLQLGPEMHGSVRLLALHVSLLAAAQGEPSAREVFTQTRPWLEGEAIPLAAMAALHFSRFLDEHETAVLRPLRTLVDSETVEIMRRALDDALSRADSASLVSVLRFFLWFNDSPSLPAAILTQASSVLSGNPHLGLVSRFRPSDS